MEESGRYEMSPVIKPRLGSASSSEPEDKGQPSGYSSNRPWGGVVVGVVVVLVVMGVSYESSSCWLSYQSRVYTAEISVGIA